MPEIADTLTPEMLQQLTDRAQYEPTSDAVAATEEA